MITARPISGDQSAFAALLLPFGEVTAAKPGRRRVAASAAFSPSHTTTGAVGFSVSLARPYSGRFGGQLFHRHSSALPAAWRHSVNGRNCLGLSYRCT